jgi:hypothetical protein
VSFVSRILLVGLVGGAACSDPVRDQAIAALGDEAPGVEPGPLHRPGQPCLACHGDTHEAPVFSVAGTVYARAQGRVPVAKATVELVDSDAHHFNATTNCAGNFFIRPDEFQPHYPLWVTVAVGSQTLDMESPMFREGSCAVCHSDPKGPASAGHAYFLLDENPDLSADHYCR